MRLTQLFATLALTSSVFSAPAGVGVSIDPVSAANTVAGWIEVKNVGDWARQKRDEVRGRFPSANLFIWKANHDKFRVHIEGHIRTNYEEHVKPWSVKGLGPEQQFRVIAFDGKGEIVNKGDGGYNNWATWGNCYTEGKKKIVCQ